MSNNASWKTALHAEYLAAYQAIDSVFRAADTEHQKALRLVGVSGVGKSDLLKRYAAQHPRAEHEDGTKVAVLHVSIPSHPSEKSLYVELLTALGDPRPAYGTATQMRDRLRAGLRSAGTKLILVDEVQHFVEHMRKTTRISDCADTFKALVNDYSGAVVMAGARSSRILFDNNSQLRSRMPLEIELRPFRWDEQASREMFCAVVKHQLPLGFANDSFLLMPETLHRLWYATDGVMRPLSFLFVRLCSYADASSKITFDLLSKAFCASLWHEPPPPRDPFSKEFTWTRLNLPGEPYAADPKEGDNHGA